VKAKGDQASATLRMPKELYSFIEGLADRLDLSRQETMLKLLEKGVEAAKNAMKLDDVAEATAEMDALPASKFHILNTNKRHSVLDHKRMFNEGCAAAFYHPWKLNIDCIQAGDIVFLYENGKGIVAYGKGTGVTETRIHGGFLDECHFQRLEGFEVLPKPISASEIKKNLQKNVVLSRNVGNARGPAAAGSYQEAGLRYRLKVMLPHR